MNEEFDDTSTDVSSDLDVDVSDSEVDDTEPTDIPDEIPEDDSSDMENDLLEDEDEEFEEDKEDFDEDIGSSDEDEISEDNLELEDDLSEDENFDVKEDIETDELDNDQHINSDEIIDEDIEEESEQNIDDDSEFDETIEEDVDTEDANTDTTDIVSEDGNADTNETVKEDANGEATDIVSEDGNADTNETVKEDANGEATDIVSEDGNTDTNETVEEDANGETADIVSEDGKADTNETVKEDANGDTTDIVSEDGNADTSETVKEDANGEATDIVSEDGNTDTNETVKEDANIETSDFNIERESASPDIDEGGNGPCPICGIDPCICENRDSEVKTETKSAESGDLVEKTPYEKLSDYMNEHNYGKGDFSTYSQDPVWRTLHREAYPDYEMPELTQENAASQLSEYMNEHNYGSSDFDTYSKDPVWQELHSAAYPDYEMPEQNHMSDNNLSSDGDIHNESGSELTQENAVSQLSAYMNEHNYTREDIDVYSQDPKWRGLQILAYPDYELPAIEENEYNSIVQSLENANVEYRAIEHSDVLRSEKEIIDRISGGDLTAGSCSSLALCYAGNKAGYDVLDFRDGASRKFFATRNSIDMISNLKDVRSESISGKNDFECANTLLEQVIPGKEFYFATGEHAAVVRKIDNHFEYLELQHPKDENGWHELNDDILAKRFGCKESRVNQCKNFLIDIDDLSNSKEFKDILGYINTSPNSQRKGGRGNVR
ncbi:hypothetical protein [Intestinibacter sp.]